MTDHHFSHKQHHHNNCDKKRILNLSRGSSSNRKMIIFITHQICIYLYILGINKATLSLLSCGASSKFIEHEPLIIFYCFSNNFICNSTLWAALCLHSFDSLMNHKNDKKKFNHTTHD